jgi:Phage derived protein Gp49-like (DUF891)
VQVKTLFDVKYRIVAVMDGEECPVDEFLTYGETTTQAARQGLTKILEYVAERGLQNIPSAWVHEVNKQNGIYEFIKGPVRLFFFKGNGNDIAICTSGGRKKGQKVDKSAVTDAISWKKRYEAAYSNGTYEVIEK